jgi:hypothetical protein
VGPSSPPSSTKSTPPTSDAIDVDMITSDREQDTRTVPVN